MKKHFAKKASLITENATIHLNRDDRNSRNCAQKNGAIKVYMLTIRTVHLIA